MFIARDIMRLLLIEDSARLRESVSTGLRKAGYAVDSAADGTQGPWQAQSNEYGCRTLHFKSHPQSL